MADLSSMERLLKERAPTAVRGSRIYHTEDCPAWKRWWWKAQVLLTTSGMTKCKHCQRIEEKHA